MRVLARAKFGLGHGGEFERSDGAATRFGGRAARFVHADGFFDLRADSHYGIERGHRLLENHGDFATA
jgi:hypothetical protein